MSKSHEEYQYEEEKAWEEEQEYYASESARAIADDEAKEQAEVAQMDEEAQEKMTKEKVIYNWANYSSCFLGIYLQTYKKSLRYCLRLLAQGKLPKLPENIEITEFAELLYNFRESMHIREALGIESIKASIQSFLLANHYHKPPEDKPPLLSDEQITRAQIKYIEAYKREIGVTLHYPLQGWLREDCVKQAQREADIKHYEGGE